MFVELGSNVAQGLFVGLRGLADGLGDDVLLVLLDLTSEARLVRLPGLDVVGELAVGGARAEDACRNRLLLAKVVRASRDRADSITCPLLVASILPARSSAMTSRRTTSKSQPNGSLANSSVRSRPLALSP
jgi:hypothetical protein